MNPSKYFELPPLPYNFDALEPVISAEMMHFHYSKHHQAYVDNHNKALNQSLEYLQKGDLVASESLYSSIIFNAGGHLNHSLFWKSLAPIAQGGGEPPTGPLMETINHDFGSLQRLIDLLSAKTIAIQGSGWGWLGLDKDTKHLIITTTANQDLPITKGFIPLLTLDVWEHAYYLKYKNARVDYVKSIWDIINWRNVENEYSKAWVPSAN